MGTRSPEKARAGGKALAVRHEDARLASRERPRAQGSTAHPAKDGFL